MLEAFGASKSPGESEVETVDAPEPAPVEVMRLKLMGWSDVRPVTADQRCKPSDIG